MPMFLPDRGLHWAIDRKHLIVEPKPKTIDPTSIDLHLDAISQAKIWDLESYKQHESAAGRDRPELRIGKFNIHKFGPKYLKNPPLESEARTTGARVYVRGGQAVVQPFGFLLW